MSTVTIVNRPILEAISKTKGQRAAVAQSILQAAGAKPATDVKSVLANVTKLVVTKEQTPEYVAQYYMSEFRKNFVVEGGFMEGARGTRSQVTELYAQAKAAAKK